MDDRKLLQPHFFAVPAHALTPKDVSDPGKLLLEDTSVTPKVLIHVKGIFEQQANSTLPNQLERPCSVPGGKQ
jgi:hypothetical protein